MNHNFLLNRMQKEKKKKRTNRMFLLFYLSENINHNLTIHRFGSHYYYLIQILYKQSHSNKWNHESSDDSLSQNNYWHLFQFNSILIKIKNEINEKKSLFYINILFFIIQRKRHLLNCHCFDSDDLILIQQYKKKKKPT